MVSDSTLTNTAWHWIFSIMNELKEMGKPLYGVLVICKNYEKYDCCHNGTKMARGCLKDIIEKGNKDRLIFATKDLKVSFTHFFGNMTPFSVLGHFISILNPKFLEWNNKTPGQPKWHYKMVYNMPYIWLSATFKNDEQLLQFFQLRNNYILGYKFCQ